MINLTNFWHTFRVLRRSWQPFLVFSVGNKWLLRGWREQRGKQHQWSSVNTVIIHHCQRHESCVHTTIGLVSGVWTRQRPHVCSLTSKFIVRCQKLMCLHSSWIPATCQLPLPVFSAPITHQTFINLSSALPEGRHPGQIKTCFVFPALLDERVNESQWNYKNEWMIYGELNNVPVLLRVCTVECYGHIYVTMCWADKQTVERCTASTWRWGKCPGLDRKSVSWAGGQTGS